MYDRLFFLKIKSISFLSLDFFISAMFVLCCQRAFRFLSNWLVLFQISFQKLHHVYIIRKNLTFDNIYRFHCGLFRFHAPQILLLYSHLVWKYITSIVALFTGYVNYIICHVILYDRITACFVSGLPFCLNSRHLSNWSLLERTRLHCGEAS